MVGYGREKGDALYILYLKLRDILLFTVYDFSASSHRRACETRLPPLPRSRIMEYPPWLVVWKRAPAPSPVVSAITMI